MLYKSRSFSSCILAAYQLMSKNLRNILKATWLPVLIYVFILASFLLINLPNEEVVALGIAHFALYIGVLASCLLGLIVTGIWALSRLMSILNEEPRRWNFMRAVWLTLNSIVITLVITAVVVAVAKLAGGYLAPYMQNHFWLFLCMAFFIVLMAVVLLLPLNYVFMKYLNERDMCFWHDFLPSYRIGLRRTSFIFITLFITGLIVLDLSLLHLADGTHPGRCLRPPRLLPRALLHHHGSGLFPAVVCYGIHHRRGILHVWLDRETP